jgi:Flp pilus assembly protein TadG
MARVRRCLARYADDRGAELIELALALPILLFVAAGIMEFGFLFQRSEVITNAVREGARIGALPGYSTLDVQTRVKNYMAASGLTCGDGCSVGVVRSTETLVNGTPVPVVTVTVALPVPSLILSAIAPLVHATAYGSVTLHATSVMRVEG